ncbi:Coenzyme F420 hydrogenase/dehydrogenase, beta subunit C-terminal domain [Verrucomicrobiales bacterium BCK34]|nr:Coenzyme F420 hydrogenase/dehydrogenase, beta subunit C-terminal domain [Verrucomicrobiales bacterium BCK34]
MDTLKTASDLYKNVKFVYLAYATDASVRQSASAGGFTKYFIWHLIESGQCDYAVITRMKGTQAETIITNNREDILATNTNSVYQFHNSVTKLKEIDRAKKYVYTSLPCYTDIVLRKYPNVLPITLFCKACPGEGYTEELISEMGLDKSKVEQLDFRDGSTYPGKNRAITESGQQKCLHMQKNWHRAYRHLGKKCQNCSFEPLHTPIAVADPWNLNEDDPWNLKETEIEGKTLVIVSNDKANQLIQDAKDAGFLNLEQKDLSVLKKSQGYHIQHKVNKINEAATRKEINMTGRTKEILVNAWDIGGGNLNFGEHIPQKILKHLGYEMVMYNNESKKHFDRCHYIIGSDLNREFIGAIDKHLVVWGGGYAHGTPFDSNDFKDQVTFRMVRGDRTAKALNVDVPRCDPGLFLPLIYPKGAYHGRVTYAPHWEGRNYLEKKKTVFKFDRYIDIILPYKEEDFVAFLNEITGSKFVMTSSLHVALACIAYRVPFGIVIGKSERLNYPAKWIDISETLNFKLKLCYNYDEAKEWYESIRYNLRYPNVEDLIHTWMP